MFGFLPAIIQASRLSDLPGGFRALRRASNLLRFLLGFGSGWRSIEAETKVAARLLRSVADPIVIDGGANRGEWIDALLLRRGGNPPQRIVLIEGSPSLAAQLEGRFPAAETLSVVIGNENKEVAFHEDGAIGTLFSRNEGTSREVRVPMERLDTIVHRLVLPRVDYLKLDIEGAEYLALRGLGEFLRPNFVLNLAFEFGLNNIRSRTYFKDFWDLLTQRGYHIGVITPRGKVAAIDQYSADLECFHGVTNFVASGVAFAR